MKRSILALAALICAGTASAQDLSYEVYAGIAAEDTDGLRYGTLIFPMDQGLAFGGGIYMDDLAGFEVGLDLMATNRRYADFDSGVESLSLMVNGRYPFELGPQVSAYAGAGLGIINVHYDGDEAFADFTGSKATAGGQIMLGLRYGLGAGQAFAEVKYQAAFDNVEIENSDVEYNSTSVFVGYRF